MAGGINSESAAEAGWIQWGLLWAGLLIGAVLGAFFQSQWPLGCLWIAAAWAGMMTLAAIRLPAES